MVPPQLSEFVSSVEYLSRLLCSCPGCDWPPESNIPARMMDDSERCLRPVMRRNFSRDEAMKLRSGVGRCSREWLDPWWKSDGNDAAQQTMMA